MWSFALDWKGVFIVIRCLVQIRIYPSENDVWFSKLLAVFDGI